MSRFRFRDDDSSNTTTVLAVLAGAVGGFALGMYMAQRVGGFEGLATRFRKMKGSGGKRGVEPADHEFDDIGEDDFDDTEDGLEEHVLEAFRNDPILAERAVDIGSIGQGNIELAGWVDTHEEADHAVTLAGGVPGVETVVNRLSVGSDEERIEEAARHAARGDAAFSERHWDGHSVGIGRRRQGNSDEIDRHSDPRVDLETKISGRDAAIRDSVDDLGESPRKGGRGVPKADHVAQAD